MSAPASRWVLAGALVLGPAASPGMSGGPSGPAEQVPTADAQAAGEEATPAVDAVSEAYRLYLEGLQARQARDPEAARSAFRRAADLDPHAAAPFVALANLSAATNDPDEAEKAALEAVARDPEAASAHRILGQILAFRYYRSEGDAALAERAITALSETVRLDAADLPSRDALAKLLVAARREEEAADHLREIVRRAPDSFDALATLARLRLAAGDLEQAFDYLLQSLRIEPRQPEARQRLEQLLSREIPGRSREEALAEVAALYEGAAAEFPEDPGLGLSLADALARLGRLDKAAKAFEELLDSDPDHQDALLGLALIRAQEFRLEEAQSLLERLIRVNSRSVPARLMLGQVFSARCEFDRAAEAFEELTRFPREAYGLARRREALARLAETRQSLGEHEASLLALREAVRLAENTPDATRFRAALVNNRLVANEPEEALRLVDELIGERPGDPGLLALKARVLGSLNRTGDALAILRDLEARFPDEGGVTHALVRFHVEAGNLAAAEERTREWLGSRPDDLLFRFQLAALLEQQDRALEAEARFRELIETDPEHDLALNYLGYMLAEGTDRLVEAEALIRRALEQDPYNGSYRDSLGWVQFRRGELDEAEPNLLHAYRCMPENAVVLDHLGDLYQAKADPEQAVRFWKLALRHDDRGELEPHEIARKIEEAGGGRD